MRVPPLAWDGKGDYDLLPACDNESEPSPWERLLCGREKVAKRALRARCRKELALGITFPLCPPSFLFASGHMEKVKEKEDAPGLIAVTETAFAFSLVAFQKEPAPSLFCLGLLYSLLLVAKIQMRLGTGRSQGGPALRASTEGGRILIFVFLAFFCFGGANSWKYRKTQINNKNAAGGFC